VLDLSGMLEHLLSRAESWVPGASRTLITQGRPAADCRLLAVWVERVDAGIGGTLVKTACMIEPRATFHVTYWGCTPTQEGRAAPTAAAITDNALDFADVGDAIWSGIVEDWAGKNLVEGANCGTIDLSQGMSVLDPQGGLAGWEATIIVTL